MLNIIDELNRLNLPYETILVGFDFAYLFSNTDRNFGFKTVWENLELGINKLSTTDSVIEILEMYLTCNNSIFNN